ncbi:DUF4365 domain-containing protein [Streptomyces mirabilis]|uniref:DUF4365 domain-containing protein n=1 Tax=Streptomyces mirabilis TaxID=68239 RepID=UPI001BAEA481|nr:DUF4365 domain-containing protein [Streptomyces mirabilis]QUW78574.1 DUF4365 domain-containing protein [Streptomyces mirabilis]
MADRKTVTRQTFIGEKGIALIERRCLEMGHLFHPRRVDHGIDGHIDLVDPDSRAVLNLTLLVQSKAQDRRFSGETDDGFHYVCDQRDLDHWLSGNSPVILVLSHPESHEAWWAEVKAAFPDAVSRASRVVHIDKHTQRFDRDAAQALLRLAMPRTAGLYLPPARTTEVLTTNLLPVMEMPPTVYLAPAAFTDYRAAGAALDARGRRESGWMLREGLVLSFRSLRDSPLRVLCDGDPERHETREWADSDDLDTQYRFADLLSRSVQDSYPELRWHKGCKHMHFRATSHLGPRKEGRGPGSRGRTVFGPHTSKADPQRVGFYHHAALRTRFRRLDGVWYCQLEPDYCFTTDGYTEHPYADRLIAGIKRLDRHPAVRGWTLVWANYLRKEADLFTEPRPVQFGELATVTVDRGIDDRSWGPAPSAVAPEPDQDLSATGQESLDTLLAVADTDTQDLLDLIQDGDEDTDVPRRRNPGSKARSAGLRTPRQGRASGARRSR